MYNLIVNIGQVKNSPKGTYIYGEAKLFFGLRYSNINKTKL